MTITRMTGWIAAAGTGLALALAGCGGDSGASTPGSGSASGSGAKLEVVLDDYSFKPQVIEGKPGQTKTLELHNEGRQAHTFTVRSQSLDKVVQPGQTATVEVTVPDKGAVPFVCRFHARMTGRLAVTGEGGASTSSGGRYGY